jgi:hypothetical protein
MARLDRRRFVRHMLSVTWIPAIVCCAGSASAQLVRFPVPPNSGAAAQASQAARADIVVRANACGREEEYMAYRNQMRAYNFDHQNEDLGSILIAKTAWLANPATARQPCGAQLVYPREVAPGAGELPRERDERYVITDRETFRAKVEADYRAALGHEMDATPQEQRCPPVVAVAMPNAWEAIVTVQLDPACMRRQVNDSISAMIKTGVMGTDPQVCLARGGPAKGDWDAVVKELVRLLYMGGQSGRSVPVLDEQTVQKMYGSLLSASGEPSGDDASLVADCGNAANEELGSPEDRADRRAWYNEAVSTIADIFKWLVETLAVRVPVLVASNVAGATALPFMLLAGEDVIPPHLDIRIPESENHRLMIESSRYLTNADLIRRLRDANADHVDDLEEEQAEVRGWLLSRLNQIAKEDFVEYNARPYTRYSLTAVGNLFDFAPDPALRTASQIVLDLSQAKFAAGSNRSRRAPPFRRLADNDGSITYNHDSPQAAFYNQVSGSDHEVARALVFAGQTQLMYDVLPKAGIGNLIYAAVGSYQPPLPVLNAAVSRPGFEQRFAHAGVEMYVQAPAYTISAGGIRTGPTGQTLGRSRDVDRGVAMPTLVIPTFSGTHTFDVFSFQGTGEQHERSENLCVAPGFACGLQPLLGTEPGACMSGIVDTKVSTRFYNSAACLPGREPTLFVAGKFVWCDGRFCVHGHEWGIYDVYAPPPGTDVKVAFAAYVKERAAAFAAVAPDAAGNATYRTSSGHTVQFVIDETRPRVTMIDGAPLRTAGVAGGLVNYDGNGRYLIGQDGGAGLVRIDVRDPTNPVRTP